MSNLQLRLRRSVQRFQVYLTFPPSPLIPLSPRIPITPRVRVPSEKKFTNRKLEPGFNVPSRPRIPQQKILSTSHSASYFSDNPTLRLRNAHPNNQKFTFCKLRIPRQHITATHPRRQFDLQIVHFTHFRAKHPHDPSDLCLVHKPLAYAKNPISLTNPPLNRHPRANRFPLPPRSLGNRAQKQPHPTHLPPQDRPVYRRLQSRPILPLPPGRRQPLRSGQPQALRYSRPRRHH